jgi:hypothetical protein
MLNLSTSLLLISRMLEKSGKPNIARDVKSAVERITELEAVSTLLFAACEGGVGMVRLGTPTRLAMEDAIIAFKQTKQAEGK